MSRVLENLIGQRFGMLTVLEQAASDSHGKRRWLCKCDCGNQAEVLTSNLKRGHSTSCGCKKYNDLTGRHIGMLTVLERSEQYGSRGERKTSLWKCRCDCGAITYKATDTLTNPEVSMCRDCAVQYATLKMRENAGYVGGTQISRIKSNKLVSTNTSGARGVYYVPQTGKWCAKLRFRGKLMSFGTYSRFEDAVKARKEAEQLIYGEFLEQIE